MKRFRPVIGLVALALLVASLVKELRIPTPERTGEGRLFGFIPYDFRFPTLARVMDAYWNPHNPRVLVPRVFGVGWSVNLYPILHPVIGSDAE